MNSFKDGARQCLAKLADCLAKLARITGIKKEKPETNTTVDTKVQCRTCSHGLQPHIGPKGEATVAAKEEWRFCPRAEFPWRLEQVVDGEENWRGTWVLEVKDLQAMDWGTSLVPKGGDKGRGGRYQRQPTRQLPFPAGGNRNREVFTGGQDDLMVYLGKRQGLRHGHNRSYRSPYAGSQVRVDEDNTLADSGRTVRCEHSTKVQI